MKRTRAAAGHYRAGDGEGAAGGRVFVEVIGFWTPAYRERKRAKLRQVAGTVPLLLVVQEQLVADFQDLALPVLPYKQRPSAADLVALLSRHFDRAEQRLAEARRRLPELVATEAAAAGFVDAEELRCRLGLSASGELAEVVANGGGLPPGWAWRPGAGLCHESWLARFDAWCAAALEARGAEPPPTLDWLRRALAAADLPAAGRAADRVEGLLPAAGFEVVWQSLFDAVVRRRPRADTP